ncbi:MAG TPA: hypothetical protein VIP28_15325 [Nocardioides sp.]
MTTQEPKRAELQPLVEEWLRSRTAFIDVVGSALHRLSHKGAWHGLRLPLYLIRLLVYSPRGLARVIRAVFNLITDDELRPLRVEAVVDRDPATALTLRKERNERVHKRLTTGAALASPVVLLALWVVSVDALAVVLGCVVLWAILRMQMNLQGLAIAVGAGLAVGIGLPYVLPPVPAPPTWTLWVGGFVLVETLGWIGRPVDKPFAASAPAVGSKVEPIRAPFVVDALVRLGIAGMKDPDEIRLLMDVARVGAGYQVDLELPVRASAVVARREDLAARMKRELGTVWPSVGRRSAAHLALYVCDQPMVEQAQKPWPLAKGPEVDVFEPQPLVTDQRGAWSHITLAYAAGVIGAQPRMGKTFTLRQVLITAGLDSRPKVYALDGKGTGDLAPTQLFAHFYSVGDDPEEVEERVLPAFRELRAEMRARAKRIRELPREECPESKVTSALAGRPGFEPIVIGIDETQAYFGYGSKGNKLHKAVREELTEICVDLVKRGPALGIWLWLATQNVSEQTIPRDISTNAVIRIALKLFDHITNDQVLGTGAYSRGVDATQFDIDDKGIAYVRADGQPPFIGRSVVGLDAVKSEALAGIIRERREAAGRLTGDALGEKAEEEALQVDLLEDCRDVLDHPPVRAMHTSELREALALLRPGVWGHLDDPALSAMLRAAGVRVGTVWSAARKSDGRGVKREWLDVAATSDIDPDADGPAEAG